MIYHKVNPSDFPMNREESWWIVNPNTPNCEFYAPTGAMAFCIKDFTVPLERENTFVEGTLYYVRMIDVNTGWIAIGTTEEIIEMPFYVFARHFDAEVFVRGIPTRTEQRKIDLENFNG